MLENRVQIVLHLESLLLLIEDKIAALRAERPNSEEARADRDQQVEHYEGLKKSVEAFHSSALEFSAGEAEEKAIVESTTSFADGIRAWWTKRHVEICDRSFEMALFTLGVGVCYLAGAGGPVAAAVTGAVLKGKSVVDAIRALPKAE